jgi:ribosome modulation factor
MALILHSAQDGPVSVEGCAARLDALFAEAGEDPALTPEERRDRLADRIRDLEIAQLLDRTEEGTWRLTDRGETAIRRNPDGVDWSVLTQYPEFAAHLRENAAHPAGMDPRSDSYSQGYAAGQEGAPFTANPYPASTVDHLSWENGWMQALDRRTE